MNRIRQAKRQMFVEKWSKIFQDRQSSGLTVGEYVEQHGLSMAQYYYWLRIIRTTILDQQDASESLPSRVSTSVAVAEVKPKPVAFIEVEKPAAVATPVCNKPVKQSRTSQSISISYQGFTIEVTDSTPKDLLFNTLALLKEVAS